MEGVRERSAVGPVDAVVALLAVVTPAAYVLRDIAQVDRPDRPVALDDLPAAAPPMTVSPVLGVGVPPVAAPVEVAAAVPVEAEAERRPREPRPEPVPPEPVRPPVHDASMLSGLTTTEQDERSAVRRAGALAVLVTLTLLTAAGVYAVIYRTVSGLG